MCATASDPTNLIWIMPAQGRAKHDSEPLTLSKGSGFFYWTLTAVGP